MDGGLAADVARLHVEKSPAPRESWVIPVLPFWVTLNWPEEKLAVWSEPSGAALVMVIVPFVAFTVAPTLTCWPAVNGFPLTSTVPFSVFRSTEEPPTGAGSGGLSGPVGAGGGCESEGGDPPPVPVEPVEPAPPTLAPRST